MPIYEYKCEDCGHVFEEFASFNQQGEVECESCGSKQTIRIFSTIANSSGSSTSADSCSFSGG